MAKMPIQKPGKSEQVVCTPKVLLDAVRGRLCIKDFYLDLAADEQNSVGLFFYDEKANSLVQSWRHGQPEGSWNWCNPPYSNIYPWVNKAFDETVLHGAHTAMLVPASTGANWWADCVNGLAHVLFLNGRVTFVGHTKPYLKDLALLLYSPVVFGGYEIWDWRKQK